MNFYINNINIICKIKPQYIKKKFCEILYDFSFIDSNKADLIEYFNILYPLFIFMLIFGVVCKNDYDNYKNGILKSLIIPKMKTKDYYN